MYALHAASYHSFMISSVDSGRLYFSLVYTEPDSNVCVLISCIYSLDTGIPLLPRKSMSTLAHTCVESSIVPSRSNMIHRQLLRSNMDNSSRFMYYLYENLFFTLTLYSSVYFLIYSEYFWLRSVDLIASSSEPSYDLLM